MKTSTLIALILFYVLPIVISQIGYRILRKIDNKNKIYPKPNPPKALKTYVAILIIVSLVIFLIGGYTNITYNQPFIVYIVPLLVAESVLYLMNIDYFHSISIKYKLKPAKNNAFYLLIGYKVGTACVVIIFNCLFASLVSIITGIIIMANDITDKETLFTIRYIYLALQVFFFSVSLIFILRIHRRGKKVLDDLHTIIDEYEERKRINEGQLNKQDVIEDEDDD